MTFLPAQVQGRWFYLYLILDLFSRKVVGFEVHETDSADHAAYLARRTALAEGVHATPAKPVLHGDNGATLKATTVLAMLAWLATGCGFSGPSNWSESRREAGFQPLPPHRVESSFLECQNGWKPPWASASHAIGARVV